MEVDIWFGSSDSGWTRISEPASRAKGVASLRRRIQIKMKLDSMVANDELLPPATRYDMASWILAGGALLLILLSHLLPALLAGLLVYELIHVLIPIVRLSRITGFRARIAAVVVLAIVIVGILSLLVLGLIAFFRSGNNSLPVLLDKMADILSDSQSMLPGWFAERIPTTAESLKEAAAEWLKHHATVLQHTGKAVGLFVTHVAVGMVIGAMVSLREIHEGRSHKPLAGCLIQRVKKLADAFRRVVFAQVWIAAVNGLLTAIYLGILLPVLGITLPLTKTLIAFTFLAGLLPVVGNLLSNTVIVVVSLSVSPSVAMGSLLFLIVIHKLEYFLNAKIIGNQIRAEAWELLTAMLVMEVLFGIPGIIAAPIYYAYVKEELGNRGLV